MSTAEFDAEGYKQAQRRDWTDAAEGWRKWWHVLEEGFGALGERLLDLADVSAGHRVLDIATGVGEPAVTAAGRVGPSGHVVGTDIAPGMLEVAKERAAVQKLGNIEFVEMDAEALDFPDGSFEAATCRFGLMFLPDRDAVLRTVARLLRPPGRFAVSVWGPPDRAAMLTATMGAVAKVLELPPPPPGTPGLFACSDQSQLRASFEDAGFVEVQSEIFPVSVQFPSVDEYISYLKDVAAPIKNLLTGQPPDRQEAVWPAIGEANEPFIRPDGVLHLTADALLCAGTRPAPAVPPPG